jgi:aspartate kinase
MKRRFLSAALADRPGVSAAIFGPLAESHINVDMIVQNISEDGSRTDMTFTVPYGRHGEGAEDP